MKYVNILKTEVADGKVQQSVVATARLIEEGKALIEGNELLAKELAGGIPNAGQGDPAYVFPSDGLVFLKALSKHFSGAYIRATDVLES